MTTATAVNHNVRLAARPSGLPTEDSWEFAESPTGEPGEGEVLVKVLQLSLDPAMRGWMDDRDSYIPPVGIGEVMRALGVGRVVSSRHEGLEDGDYVSSFLGVQEYAVVPGDGLTKVDPDLAPLPVHLSTLGMPGMTAYFGLLDVGRPQEGETVVVSAAAGAVGSVVGQIAKIKGCQVVGIAGGPEKCAYIVDELGFDAAIDYKAEDVEEGLGRHCPKGLNLYFDNVGGDVLDAALTRLAKGARVVLCGAISQYNSEELRGPTNYLALLIRRATMTGFIILDYLPRYGEALDEMSSWLKSGKLKSREDIVEGLENFPSALTKLYTGENHGKLVLKVAEDD
jgi:NADPH-dependent curcumin reductase CurA